MNKAIERVEAELEQYFKEIDKIRDFNQEKVLKAFVDNKAGAEHFATVSGYGHDDMGRETLDKIYAQTFGCEKAIVRNQFVSGTHTLACCLFGNLRYGDKLLSVAGAPYDTMEEVIGKRGDIGASLIGHGVSYDEVPLLKDNVDFEGIARSVNKNTTMVLIQRSRGYSTRKSLDINTIEKIIKIVKNKNPDCICFVDNCYGEFSEKLEPPEVGADLIAGSLIKNPGGGIVECGGYIAGKEKFVEAAAKRLTAPGIGSLGGAMLNQTRLIMQGFFMAPSITADAIKGSVLAAKVFEDAGYNCSPRYNDKRTDIIQTIVFGTAEPLIAFCRALQKSSPIDGFLTPIPNNDVGYDDLLIMAGGTFIEGSTIELSADAPLRKPYAVYLQGGLNYAHVKIAISNVLDEISNLCKSSSLVDIN